jgi:hypothetical protein
VGVGRTTRRKYDRSARGVNAARFFLKMVEVKFPSCRMRRSAAQWIIHAPRDEHNKQRKQVENATHAGAKKDTRIAMRGRWDRFQTMVNGCDTKISSAREECLVNARDTFRAANFKCDALGAERRTSCLHFAERWNSAVADAPGAPVKHAEEPTVTATDPGDPRPAERNRDSTKQH